MAQPLPQAPDLTYSELIAQLLFNAALGGNLRAITALLDRIEGRPRLAPPPTASPTSLVDSEKWIRLRDTLCDLLEPLPEVQAAVIKALDDIEEALEDPEQ